MNLIFITIAVNSHSIHTAYSIMAFLAFLSEPAIFYFIFKNVNSSLNESKLELKDWINAPVVIFYWLFYSAYELLIGLKISRMILVDSFFIKWLFPLVFIKSILFLWFLFNRPISKFKGQTPVLFLYGILIVYFVSYNLIFLLDLSFDSCKGPCLKDGVFIFFSGVVWLSLPLWLVYKSR